MDRYDAPMVSVEFPIRSARLELRPFLATDVDDINDYQRLPEVARYLYWEPRDRDETAAVLAHKMAAAGAGAVLLAVVLPTTGRVIGEVNLTITSGEYRQGEIGFVFHPDFQGHGFATEAAAELLRIGFDTVGLHRICAHCDARNTASARVMERLGMRCEAHFVHNEIFKGEWGDELVYAIREDRWRTR